MSIKKNSANKNSSNSKLKENERFISLTPEIPTEIHNWRNTVNENFPDLLIPAEAGLSVMAQLLIRDIKNPFALVFVDVPSSGKTIALNFFSTIKDLIYTTDNFTPASFVSHSANTKKEQLEKNDMLPQIKNKTMIVRDLAPIFAKRDEDVQAMLGILIRVLDGEGLETNSGLYGKRGYVGEYLFMMLSASTPIRPKIWNVMGNLGSRLFFINLNSVEKDEATLVDQLKNPCKDKEIKCKQISENFIKTLWSKYPAGIDWKIDNDNPEIMKISAKFAMILAKLRSSINEWGDSFGDKKYNNTQPITEKPDRLNQLIYNLMRGHALACGRENIAYEDLGIVYRIALDSAPPNRSKIFKELIKNNGRLTTGSIMEILKCSTPTALKHMDEFKLLEIADINKGSSNNFNDDGGRPEHVLILKNKYEWFISDECRNYLSTMA
ncbi:MAG: hypothetical protein HGA36_00900 [Candidatus Moranbacteria bacterium]|nr:hypothetical protein [Candidatus Moranbacteria bacterium]